LYESWPYSTRAMQQYSTSGVVSPIQLLDLTTSLEFRPNEGTAASQPLVVTVSPNDVAPGTTDAPIDETFEAASDWSDAL
jgi:hypothetical protein